MYDIRVDYYQHEWNSRVKLSWIRPGDAARKLLLPGNKRLACSTKCGAYVRFEAATGETVRAWVGTSFISEEDARANLEREIAGAGVDKIARATAAKWNEALACIELPGATEQQKQVFYTALYHAFLLPRSISETADTGARTTDKSAKAKVSRIIPHGIRSGHFIRCWCF